MKHNPLAKAALLDAAERLFAQHGIAGVSDRKVAQEAGNTNHSAVSYYFGGREGLLTALIERHMGDLDPDRRGLFDQSTTLIDDVRALVMPHVNAMAQLPTPSWRARFMSVALADPATFDKIRLATDEAPTPVEIYHSIVARLDHLDDEVVRGRARLMTHLINTMCADLEARAEESGEPAQWQDAGNFLCDAVAGMLQAPITHPLRHPVPAN